MITRLELDECVPAGTVHVWFGWRRRQFEKGTYAEITTQCANRETTGPVQDKRYVDWRHARHHPNPSVDRMKGSAGPTVCYWDSVCNIRRYEGVEA